MKTKFISIPRKYGKQTLAEAANTCTGIGRTKKRGKKLKAATMVITYGAGNRKAQKVSGLSLRRIKVIRKALVRDYLKGSGIRAKYYITAIRPDGVHPLHSGQSQSIHPVRIQQNYHRQIQNYQRQIHDKAYQKLLK